MRFNTIADDSRSDKSSDLKKKLERHSLDRANAIQTTRNRKQIKKLNTPQLKRLNNLSISKDYNRNLSDTFFDKVDRNGTHILSVLMVHEHAQMRQVAPHYRCLLLAKMRRRRNPVTLILDLPIDTFNSLKDAVA